MVAVRSMTLWDRKRMGILVFALLAALLAACRYRLVVVNGVSMEPTLRDRQCLLMDKGPSSGTSLRRGDIVVFRVGSELLIKRVYAVSGDIVRQVEFANGITYVSGDEPFPEEGLVKLARRHAGILQFTQRVVPEGQVFVLGDNSPRSVDSRAFGSIDARQIIGRIVSAPSVARVITFGRLERVGRPPAT